MLVANADSKDASSSRKLLELFVWRCILESAAASESSLPKAFCVGAARVEEIVLRRSDIVQTRSQGWATLADTDLAYPRVVPCRDRSSRNGPYFFAAIGPYIGEMVLRSFGRGRPLNASAAFIHPCQPTSPSNT